MYMLILTIFLFSRHMRQDDDDCMSDVFPLEDIRGNNHVLHHDLSYIPSGTPPQGSTTESMQEFTICRRPMQQKSKPACIRSSSVDHSLNSSAGLCEEPEHRMQDSEFQTVQSLEADRSTAADTLTRNQELSAESLSTESVVLVYKNKLIQLAQKCMIQHCDICREGVSVTNTVKGSCIKLSWVCCNGHIAYQWSSQHTVRKGLHLGDVMIAAAIFLTGNNYAKIALLAKCLGLAFIHQASYYRLQRRYIVPVVTDYWNEMVRNMLSTRKHINVTILGDGRMDSPGHSAQYCTYTCMDEQTKEILLIQVVDKRETELSSPRMEKLAFERCIKTLQDSQLKIDELVTDAHPQIAKLMRTRYASIKHSFDMWHGAKNLAKRINKAGLQRGCRILCQWTRQIVNHFWYCCQHSESTEEFMIHWGGILYHVVNQHEWGSGIHDNYEPVGQCQHESLGVEHAPPWLEPDSPAHEKLRQIVLDPRFVEKTRHYVSYRTTAELEQFHQVILKYASKRQSYTFPAFRARNFLAAIDHNSHRGRPYARNKEGRYVYRRKFNKKSGRWTVVRMKQSKDYNYLIPIKEKILQRRLADHTKLHERATLSYDDPRNIQPTIAPYQPPDTRQLVEEHLSRFQQHSDNL
ncbi:uncharacterized protein LOC122808886 [Protopterus annectens]|uniref:uncharacterized protein LOC122808886 n=1 Tax=Protopterus annectens TaxID=7888 RepID=UPI001CFA4760|nr:uncharacterized protein LOC122808886 [Protopterus annectens]